MSEGKGDAFIQSEGTCLTPQAGIRQAREFFVGLGFAISENGLLKPPFTQDQLEKLKIHRESIMQISGGIEMPTEEDFYRSVLLATSLYPQAINGEIQYLIGRGAGVEIALRGNVAGRQKQPVEISYRGHSDLDLYGVDYNVAADSNEDLGGKAAYPLEFVEVFGHEEYYPLKATKALHGIPGRMLHETADMVDLGDVSVIVPELELLALDKLLTPEATPRQEGSDAFMLALAYDLDRNKMLDYYERFVVSPEKGTLQQAITDRAEGILTRLAHRQHKLEFEVMQRDGISRSEARKKITKGMQQAIDNFEDAMVMKEKVRLARRDAFDAWVSGGKPLSDPSTNYLIARATEEILPGMWIPLSETDLSDDGEISPDYRHRMVQRVEEVEGEEMREKRYSKVLSFFAEVDRAKERIGTTK